MSTTITSTLGPPHIRVQMLSDPTYLSGARELVASVARRLGFSEEGCGQIALAVDEALCNVIRHGYERRKDAPIWINLWPLPAANGTKTRLSGPGIAIVLEDEAKQVDPSIIKSRDLDEIRPGGLGVHIIQQVMDEAVYEKRDEKGMRLTLIKRVPASESACGCKGACGEREG
jgi:anti-sigma regulatory factor (Ser/Thr protein kinase)